MALGLLDLQAAALHTGRSPAALREFYRRRKLIPVACDLQRRHLFRMQDLAPLIATEAACPPPSAPPARRSSSSSAA